MTPKEKANELIMKFIPPTRQFDERDGWHNYIDSAKECALISVEMVINQFNGIDDTNLAKMGWKYRKWKFGQG